MTTQQNHQRGYARAALSVFGACLTGYLAGLALLGVGIVGVPFFLIGLIGAVLAPISLLDIIFGIFGHHLGVGDLAKALCFLAGGLAYIIMAGCGIARMKP